MELTLENRHCTLCGPTGSSKLKYEPNFEMDDLNSLTFSARRLPDKKHYAVKECSNCGIHFSDPVCPPDILEKLYRQSSVNYSEIEPDLFHTYSRLLDRALVDVSGRDCFVEVGGGTGFMLEYGAKRGFRLQVEIEPSQSAYEEHKANFSSTKFFPKAFDAQTLNSNSVDLFCFFHVLDHLPSPTTFVSQVYHSLKNGGSVVAAVHNTGAISARLFGEWSPIYNVEHTYLFNRDNLRKLFLKSGFKNVRVFPYANRYPLSYWLHALPLSSRVRERVTREVEVMRLQDFRIPIYAGNICVIASKFR